MAEHGKEYFYKYIKIEGAVSILKDSALKWTCPLDFNDPFDIRQDLNFSFDEEEFFDAYKNRCVELLYNNEQIFKHVEFWKKMRAEKDSFPKSFHETFFLSQKQKIATDHASDLRLFQQSWHEQIKRYRVLCLTENSESLLMWSHYAHAHQGVMVKFRCIDNPQSHFRDAKSVKYHHALPVIATLSEWVDDLIGVRPQPLDDKEIFRNIIFTKNNEWAYEKEWRCIVDDPRQLNFYTLMPEEIDAMYLGCKMSEKNKNLLLASLAEKWAHLKIYQANKNSRAYKLDFERIR